ncbi:MAG: alpha/beta fold hydrolase [Magnetospirillum sp.]|nr:alpha/beta fold hydrolase [Magnetospirillum sp.]
MNLPSIEAGSGPPVVLLHGLLGSSRNWNSLIRSLAGFRHAIALDLPNHGSAPWADTMAYRDLAGEVAGAIERIGPSAAVLGHSMGGKVAMTLALTRPELVERLIVVDIAPVAYSHSFTAYIRAMRSVPLGLGRRGDVDAVLAQTIADARVRAFLSQNLDGMPGAWRWKPNLAVLEQAMGEILAFPDFPIGVRYEGSVLVIAGAESDYVRPRDEPAIHRLFPNAAIRRISGAGHWVHADRYDEFLGAVTHFLAP